jgi:hypothetical protein
MGHQDVASESPWTSKTRQVIAFHVGDRSRESAKQVSETLLFAKKLANHIGTIKFSSATIISRELDHYMECTTQIRG